MTQIPSAAESASPRDLSGATRILAGFIIGALFAVAPMYYVFSGRAGPAASTASGSPQLAGEASAEEQARPATSPPEGRGKRFASRMTYELSQLPEEPLVTPVNAAAPAPLVPGKTQDDSRTRVANSRAISPLPLAPRDRTVAIEQEGREAEYRGRAGSPAAAVRPLVIEGREVNLKQPQLPGTPTRPILALSQSNTRAEIEAERTRVAAVPPSDAANTREQPASSGMAERAASPAAPPVPGVTPIKRAPVMIARADTAPGVSVAPPASTPGTAEAAESAGDDVEARIAATREWLSASPESTHTIQLMGTHSEAHLKTQLKALAKVLEPTRIYVFRTMAQRKPAITVLYGAYPDKKSALQALEKLPPTIASNRPVLRTVNGIRTEMKQHKTDS